LKWSHLQLNDQAPLVQQLLQILAHAKTHPHSLTRRILDTMLFHQDFIASFTFADGEQTLPQGLVDKLNQETHGSLDHGDRTPVADCLFGSRITQHTPVPFLRSHAGDSGVISFDRDIIQYIDDRLPAVSPLLLAFIQQNKQYYYQKNQLSWEFDVFCAALDAYPEAYHFYYNAAQAQAKGPQWQCAVKSIIDALYQKTKTNFERVAGATQTLDATNLAVVEKQYRDYSERLKLRLIPPFMMEVLKAIDCTPKPWVDAYTRTAQGFRIHVPIVHASQHESMSSAVGALFAAFNDRNHEALNKIHQGFDYTRIQAAEAFEVCLPFEVSETYFEQFANLVFNAVSRIHKDLAMGELPAVLKPAVTDGKSQRPANSLSQLHALLQYVEAHPQSDTAKALKLACNPNNYDFVFDPNATYNISVQFSAELDERYGADSFWTFHLERERDIALQEIKQHPEYNFERRWAVLARTIDEAIKNNPLMTITAFCRRLEAHFGENVVAKVCHLMSTQLREQAQDIRYSPQQREGFLKEAWRQVMIQHPWLSKVVNVAYQNPDDYAPEFEEKATAAPLAAKAVVSDKTAPFLAVEAFTQEFPDVKVTVPPVMQAHHRELAEILGIRVTPVAEAERLYDYGYGNYQRLAALHFAVSGAAVQLTQHSSVSSNYATEVPALLRAFAQKIGMEDNIVTDGGAYYFLKLANYLVPRFKWLRTEFRKYDFLSWSRLELDEHAPLDVQLLQILKHAKARPHSLTNQILNGCLLAANYDGKNDATFANDFTLNDDYGAFPEGLKRYITNRRIDIRGMGSQAQYAQDAKAEVVPPYQASAERTAFLREEIPHKQVIETSFFQNSELAARLLRAMESARLSVAQAQSLSKVWFVEAFYQAVLQNLDALSVVGQGGKSAVELVSNEMFNAIRNFPGQLSEDDLARVSNCAKSFIKLFAEQRQLPPYLGEIFKKLGISLLGSTVQAISESGSEAGSLVSEFADEEYVIASQSPVQFAASEQQRQRSLSFSLNATPVARPEMKVAAEQKATTFSISWSCGEDQKEQHAADKLLKRVKKLLLNYTGDAELEPHHREAHYAEFARKLCHAVNAIHEGLYKGESRLMFKRTTKRKAYANPLEELRDLLNHVQDKPTSRTARALIIALDHPVFIWGPQQPEPVIDVPAEFKREVLPDQTAPVADDRSPTLSAASTESNESTYELAAKAVMCATYEDAWKHSLPGSVAGDHRKPLWGDPDEAVAIREDAQAGSRSDIVTKAIAAHDPQTVCMHEVLNLMGLGGEVVKQTDAYHGYLVIKDLFQRNQDPTPESLKAVRDIFKTFNRAERIADDKIPRVNVEEHFSKFAKLLCSAVFSIHEALANGDMRPRYLKSVHDWQAKKNADPMEQLRELLMYVKNHPNSRTATALAIACHGECQVAVIKPERQGRGDAVKRKVVEKLGQGNCLARCGLFADAQQKRAEQAIDAVLARYYYRVPQAL
jgi:hypothetical protein